MESERANAEASALTSLAPSGGGARSEMVEETGTVPDANRLAPSSAERREHSRRFSNIHTRNLSAFFPQPGTAAEFEYHASQASTRSPSPVNVAPAGEVPQESPTHKQKRDARQIRRASYLMTDQTGNVNVARRMPSQLPSCTWLFSHSGHRPRRPPFSGSHGDTQNVRRTCFVGSMVASAVPAGVGSVAQRCFPKLAQVCAFVQLRYTITTAGNARHLCDAPAGAVLCRVHSTRRRSMGHGFGPRLARARRPWLPCGV